MSNSDKILVVGAGPTGLMLSCWLARAGIQVRVVDSKPGPSLETRAVAVQARTMETYDMLGLGTRALSEGIPARSAAVWLRRRRVARAVLEDMGRGISPHPYMFMMGQDHTERMLLDDLRAHGGNVSYNTSLLHLSQDDHQVSADLQGADGHLETVQARYVCGCDGAKSLVRHAVGLDFPGGTYSQRFFVADVVARGPIEEGELGLCFSKTGFLAFFPMRGPNHYRVVGIVPAAIADRADLGFRDVKADVKRQSGMDVSEVFWFATYNVHHRVAPSFRRGRAFLLGDAGHIHSPVGGQGMNTGLMDASNLGWKLAAVMQGSAHEKILESYEPERMPFARQLVATTDRIFTLASSPLPLLSALRDVVLPRLFALVTRLPIGRRWVFGLVSQTRISYRSGPLSEGRVGSIHGGDRLPWVRWSDGASNFHSLKLLRPHIQVYGPVPPEIQAFADAHPSIPLVKLPGGPEVRTAGLQDGSFYFLRPDGYIAYAASRLDADAFTRYLDAAWGAGPDRLNINLSNP